MQVVCRFSTAWRPATTSDLEFRDIIGFVSGLATNIGHVFALILLKTTKIRTYICGLAI